MEKSKDVKLIGVLWKTTQWANYQLFIVTAASEKDVKAIFRKNKPLSKGSIFAIFAIFKPFTFVYGSVLTIENGYVDYIGTIEKGHVFNNDFDILDLEEKKER